MDAAAPGWSRSSDPANRSSTRAARSAESRSQAFRVGTPAKPSSCHDLFTASSYARRRQDRGHTSHLRRMQSPTDPTDRTGTIGVEAFDAAYGAGFQASDDSPHAVECELVEDDGAFVAHRPTDADRPRRVAPDHRDGWLWEPYAVDGGDVETAASAAPAPDA